MTSRNHVDPEKTEVRMKLDRFWTCVAGLVAAVVWVTVLVYDIRSDLRQIKAELWTRTEQERFAFRLERDNRALNLVVREPDGAKISYAP